jgi:hypothetical protein
MKDSRKILQRKISHLESLMNDLEYSDCQVIHQTTYLMNEIDYLKAMLMQIDVEEYFSEEEES